MTQKGVCRRRLALFALLAAAPSVGAPAPFPKDERASRIPNAAQVSERGRVLAAFVHPGMTETQVTALLGKPTRTFGDLCGERWFYPGLEITVRFRFTTTKDVVTEVQHHPTR
jgi:outer membrane protein assembly factor BamE (lipoprotein component of BamABCDE complex)